MTEREPKKGDITAGVLSKGDELGGDKDVWLYSQNQEYRFGVKDGNAVVEEVSTGRIVNQLSEGKNGSRIKFDEEGGFFGQQGATRLNLVGEKTIEVNGMGGKQERKEDVNVWATKVDNSTFDGPASEGKDWENDDGHEPDYFVLTNDGRIAAIKGGIPKSWDKYNPEADTGTIAVWGKPHQGLKAGTSPKDYPLEFKLPKGGEKPSPALGRWVDFMNLKLKHIGHQMGSKNPEIPKFLVEGKNKKGGTTLKDEFSDTSYVKPLEGAGEANKAYKEVNKKISTKFDEFREYDKHLKKLAEKLTNDNIATYKKMYDNVETANDAIATQLTKGVKGEKGSTAAGIQSILEEYPLYGIMSGSVQKCMDLLVAYVDESAAGHKEPPKDGKGDGKDDGGKDDGGKGDGKDDGGKGDGKDDGGKDDGGKDDGGKDDGGKDDGGKDDGGSKSDGGKDDGGSKSDGGGKESAPTGPGTPTPAPGTPTPTPAPGTPTPTPTTPGTPTPTPAPGTPTPTPTTPGTPTPTPAPGTPTPTPTPTPTTPGTPTPTAPTTPPAQTTPPQVTAPPQPTSPPMQTPQYPPGGGSALPQPDLPGLGDGGLTRPGFGEGLLPNLDGALPGLDSVLPGIDGLLPGLGDQGMPGNRGDMGDMISQITDTVTRGIDGAGRFDPADWLSGRENAHDNPGADQHQRTPWSTGDVPAQQQPTPGAVTAPAGFGAPPVLPISSIGGIPTFDGLSSADFGATSPHSVDRTSDDSPGGGAPGGIGRLDRRGGERRSSSAHDESHQPGDVTSQEHEDG
ncbi:hypothetical protein [Nocardia cyriacigeorgica]|uniref:hypothetical protein n=1 Tax=Nocardia cyriacigeorgica TaxID=135487 RepID=UPI0018932BFA|nr:hypothetical protein [Nocardia cyriacigeorgica]MBF6093515.1 hypothetical protein [Nocardia cyriacigeorgica]